MFQKMIEKGESKTVEFKADLPHGNQLAQTICAFANRAGGYVLIGVSDGGEVIGLSSEDINSYLEKIPNLIHDTIFPMLIPEIYSVTVLDKAVLVIQVYPGSNLPYYMKSKGKIEGTYVRVGRTNKRADMEMIKELERHRMNKSFDEDTFKELIQSDVESLINVLENAMASSITKEKLLNLKLIERVGEMEYLTNAGAVILGKMGNTSVKCARFSGESIVDFIDKKEHSGDVFTVINKSMIFLKNHLMHAGMIQGYGLKRKDVLEVPEEVLREGLINALMHRDYAIQGSDIKIAIFDSKIEITSPGGLPKSLAVEDIYSGRSEIRNRVISNLLLKSGYVEQWGSGIPRMIEMCKEVGLKVPEIEEKGLFIVLRIFRKDQMHKSRLEYLNNDLKFQPTSEPKPERKTKSDAIADHLNQIYALLVEDNQLTVKEIADKVYLAEASTQRRLKTLQDQGMIERVGSKKTGQWVIKKE